MVFIYYPFIFEKNALLWYYPAVLEGINPLTAREISPFMVLDPYLYKYRKWVTKKAAVAWI